MADKTDAIVLRYKNEDFVVPEVLLENFGIFKDVVSMNTWKNILSDEDREHLQKFLPKFPKDGNNDNALEVDTLKRLFSQENFKFGSPLKLVWQQLNAGEFQSDIANMKDDLKKEQEKLNQQQQKESFMKMFEVLFKRHQSLLAQRIGGAGSDLKSARKRKKFRSTVETRAAKKFKSLMSKFHSERGEEDSSDEDLQFSATALQNSETTQPATSQWYNDLLRRHRKRRRQLGDKLVTVAMDTTGITLEDVIRRDQEMKNGIEEEEINVVETEEEMAVATPVKWSTKKSPKEPMFKPLEKDSPLFPVQEIKERKKFMGVKVDTPIQLSQNPPSGLYSSFFALLKCIFLSMKGHKGELSKIEKKVGQWQRSSEYSQCQWVDLQPSWIPLVQSALCYLGGEVGATSLVDPVPGFMPYIEFRDRVDNWRWIGHGRDSNLELYVLFKHWLDTLDKADTVIDYSDYLPPVTSGDKDLTLKSLSPEEVIVFHKMERQRYSNPHKAFRFTIHGYESAVGPLKGIPKQGVAVSKAREHFLLKSERPSVVTILSLVRDASSRLPGGEGTRAEICGLVRESQYVRDVTDSQINAAVSGALDRLHYEKDPCVRYDSSRKLWIYLHRARTEDDFERIHREVEKAIRNRKKLMSKPVRMKIILPSGVEAETGNNDDYFPITSEEVSQTYFTEDIESIMDTEEPLTGVAPKKKEYSKGTKRAKPAPALTTRSKPEVKQRLQLKNMSIPPVGFNRKFYSTSVSSEDEADILRVQLKTTKPTIMTTQPSSGSSSSSGEEEEIPFINTNIPPPSISIHDKGNLEALEQIFDSDSEEQ